MLQADDAGEGQQTISSAGSVVPQDWPRWGELSHARRALEGEPVAPSNENTWKALTNEAKRPRTARDPTVPWI